MDEDFIVLMKRDSKTGFLETEIANIKMEENYDFIYNIYLEEEEEERFVVLNLSTEKDLEDWEFSAVFDFYEKESFGNIPQVESILERDDYYNPIWEIKFHYQDNVEELEKILKNIVDEHARQLKKIYQEILESKEEYL